MPIVPAVLKDVEGRHRQWVILRELLYALAVLLLFLSARIEFGGVKRHEAPDGTRRSRALVRVDIHRAHAVANTLRDLPQR